MKDNSKTKKQLINELTELRSQDAALKKSMAGSISAEPVAEEALRYAESIVETVREPLMVLDEDLTIISANRNFYRTFKVTPDETIGSFIYNLGNKQWDIPKLRELLEEVLPEKEAFDDFEVAHTFQDIGHKIMLLNARQIYRKDIGAKMILLAIEDITERKQANDILQESNRKYKTLVENIPQKIFTKDRNSVYVSCNENFARDLGITTEEYTGKDDYVYFPKELADKYRADDKRIMESGDAEDIEEQYIKDGQTFWVHTKKTPLMDDEGNIKGILGIFDDITERKLAEHALREREERYRSLVDAIGQSNIGLLIMDAGYRVRFMNEPMVMAFGDQTGCICYEGLGKANSPCSYCRMDEVIKQGSIVTYQSTVANGRTYDIVAVPFQDTDGTACKLEVLRDITESKLVERALLESNQRLRRIYESGMLGIIYWNMNGQIIDANDRFLEMVGYTRDELESGKVDWINMTPPEFQYLDDNAVKELNATGVNKIPYEKEYIRKDGTRMPIILAGATLDEDKFNGVAFVLDITERKQVEEKLQNTLESLRKSFAATIQVLIAAVESRDPYTSGHQIRSADLARAIATEMELPQGIIEGLRMAGSIHDIGKLSIPAEILSKPTKLSDLEFSLIKEHAQRGYEMLKDVESPWPLAKIVYQHHERMDGSGYPRNLKGEEICMEARILAVADVVEAMASHRPYRPSLGIDAALAEIEKNRGIVYDDAVADACLRLFREKGFQLEGT